MIFAAQKKQVYPNCPRSPKAWWVSESSLSLDLPAVATPLSSGNKKARCRVVVWPTNGRLRLKSYAWLCNILRITTCVKSEHPELRVPFNWKHPKCASWPAKHVAFHCQNPGPVGVKTFWVMNSPSFLAQTIIFKNQQGQVRPSLPKSFVPVLSPKTCAELQGEIALILLGKRIPNSIILCSNQNR